MNKDNNEINKNNLEISTLPDSLNKKEIKTIPQNSGEKNIDNNPLNKEELNNFKINEKLNTDNKIKNIYSKYRTNSRSKKNKKKKNIVRLKNNMIYNKDKPGSMPYDPYLIKVCKNAIISVKDELPNYKNILTRINTDYGIDEDIDSLEKKKNKKIKKIINLNTLETFSNFNTNYTNEMTSLKMNNNIISGNDNPINETKK